MTRTKRTLGFLPEIDGLRAFAVLAVVLFHLQIPGFSGGYVGVDIFFVISGFLISAQIQERLASGQFTLSGFYANRIRRLLPAVIATVAVTFLSSLWLLPPDALSAFARSALASVLSAANFVFYTESGYWDADAEMKPLLHMWSLGIEEQFYLFWPMTIIWLTRVGRKLYVPGLIVLLLISLGACIAVSQDNTDAAFYLLPFRVWQFCLGALAVEGWKRVSLSKTFSLGFQTLGIALCLFAILSFGNVETFPGAYALVPSIGTFLVLLACQPSSPLALLANPVTAWLGRASYSLYLVHWPPIVLYRVVTLEELTGPVQVALAGLMLLLTIILHYGVERRFYQRARHRSEGWQGVPRISVLTSISIAAIAALTSQFPDRLSQKDIVLTASQIEAYRTGRFQLVKQACRVDRIENPKFCPQPLNQSMLFLGNSLEPDGFNIMNAALRQSSQLDLVAFGTINDCGNMRIENDWPVSSKAACQRRLTWLKNSLENQTWRVIIYSALHPDSANKEGLITILEAIKSASPETKIIVLDDFIELRHDCSVLINTFGSSSACANPQYVSWFPSTKEAPHPFKKRLNAIADVRVSKIALLCANDSPESCVTETPDGHPMYIDQRHMTYEFATFVGNQLALTDPNWLSSLQNKP